MNSPSPAPEPGQHRNWTRRLVNVIVALAVIAVAAAAFVFSYDGVHAVALLGGMSPRLARYYPGLFDAVLVIACVAAIMLRDGRWWARLWAWLVFIVLLAAIGATDVLHAAGYTLRHRPTEGVVAAAPVVAVLLAFSLLLTLLRQPRTRPAVAPAVRDSEPGRPAVPASPGVHALPVAATIALPAAPAAAVPPREQAAEPVGAPAREAAQADDGPVLERPVLERPVPVRPALEPPTADRPALNGPVPDPAVSASPVTPPDGLPVLRRPAAEPSEVLTPAEPDEALTPAESVSPSLAAAPATAPEAVEEAAPEPVEETAPEPVSEAAWEPVAWEPATEPTAEPATEPVAAATEEAATEPAAELTAEPATEPVPAATEEPAAVRPGIRYAGGVSGRPGRPLVAEPEPNAGPAQARDDSADYWDGEEGEQYAGLVYTAGADTALSANGADGPQEGTAADSATGSGLPRRRPPGSNGDAPSFATAPYGSIPRLNRVRSMPAPPADDEDE